MANYIFKTDTDSEYTAVTEDKILADTTNNSFAIKLPASPSAGNWVHILDVSGNFDSNPLTVDGNSKNIVLPVGSGPTYVDSVKGDAIFFIWSTTFNAWTYYRLNLVPQALRGNWGV